MAHKLQALDLITRTRSEWSAGPSARCVAGYLQRIADRELVERLGYIGAVLIEGPKACGKIATATQRAQTVIRLDEDETARRLMTLAPERFFDNPTPILFDEWQGVSNPHRRRLAALGGWALLGDEDAPDEPVRVRSLER